MWGFFKPVFNFFGRTQDEVQTDANEAARVPLKRKIETDDDIQRGQDRKQARRDVTDDSQPSTSSKTSYQKSQNSVPSRRNGQENQGSTGNVLRNFLRLFSGYGEKEQVDVEPRMDVDNDLDVATPLLPAVTSPVHIIDPNSVPYSENSEEMARALKANARTIVYDQNERFVAAEDQRRRRIQDDPVLSANYAPPTPMHPDQVDFESEARGMLVQADKNKQEQKKKKFRKENLAEFSISTDRQQLGGKRSRIQITSNITGNQRDVIPAFCDVSKSLQDLQIPESLTYEYVYENRCDQLKSLEEELNKDIYENKCNCHEQQPPIECWNNENCPCYQRNRKLMPFQGQGNHPVAPGSRTQFSSFAPINLIPFKSSYTLGYACSEECSCRGQCGNNATLLYDKKLHSLELERKNAALGFQCGSLNYLPPGTVIADMTGEVIDNEKLDVKNYHYSFNINFGDSKNFKNNPIEVIPNATPKLKKEMNSAYKEEWNVDTMKIGNVGRMLNHSCEPNVDTVRVFQKGLAPSHMRLLLVTIKPIFPGDEATIDYGPNYKFPRGGCKCGTISCVNTKTGNISQQDLATMLKDRYAEKYSYYHQQVLGKLTF